MRIRLAGINREVGKEKIKGEIIPVAYARISRSPLSIDEIREKTKTDIEGARKSAERIVFGYGHRSVAEHLVFNFDIEDISRIAVEYIEKHRLISFTEKSQRYVRLKKGFYIPSIADKSIKKLYIDAMEELFNAYERGLKISKDSEGILEDYRYFLPLSTLTQLGMTINARSLEYLIESEASNKLDEIKTLILELTKIGKHYAPSLIKYTQPANIYDRIEKKINTGIVNQSEDDEDVRLIKVYGNEEDVVSSILFQKTSSYFNISKPQLSSILETIFEHMDKHFLPPRAFELVSYTFLITLSASAYAQLKRHRMMTVIRGEYNFNDYIVPERLKHESSFFSKYVEKYGKLYKILKDLGLEEYMLLNAHRRKVLVHINAREMYHLASLRMDKHAQWEIRNIVRKMVGKIREHHPLLLLLATGKDDFDKRKNYVLRLLKSKKSLEVL